VLGFGYGVYFYVHERLCFYSAGRYIVDLEGRCE